MKPNKILYAIGPGDVINSFNDWQNNQITKTETSITFSSQFFDFCKRNDIAFWAISSNSRKANLKIGNMHVENRPKSPNGHLSGLNYHVRQVRYALSLLKSSVKFNTDLVIIDSGTTHWFMLILFRFFGIKVINNFHTTLWPAGYPPSRFTERLISYLDGFYLRWFSNASMGVSPECQRQAVSLAGKELSFYQFRPMYNRGGFEIYRTPNHADRPFRIMFAGRIEKNKGVFDILSIAREIKKRSISGIVFELCGDGSSTQELVKMINVQKLENVVSFNGMLTRSDLLAVYNRCHLIIIPTTHEFNEGFAMVAAEAIIMGRPIISSSVVPAAEVLNEATILAKTSNIDDYTDKIINIASDTVRYNELCAACENLQPIFFDRENSISSSLSKAIKSIWPCWLEIKSDTIPRGSD